MKTYYFKQLKSGNYEIGTPENHTHNTTDLVAFFNQISRERSNVWNRRAGRMEPCRIIKARYSQSQTYFTSAAELERRLA